MLLSLLYLALVVVTPRINYPYVPYRLPILELALFYERASPIKDPPPEPLLLPGIFIDRPIIVELDIEPYIDVFPLTYDQVFSFQNWHFRSVDQIH